MTFSELRKEIAQSVDLNDNYTPLRLIAEKLEIPEEGLYELDSVQREHDRVGHLTPQLRIERDEFTENLKSAFYKVYTKRMWDTLGI